MKIRFKFEIDECRTLDLAPRDFRDCYDLDELHKDLLDQSEPSYRVSVNADDLAAFWALVQEAREPME